MVSTSSSPSDGHDLELRPYVVARELTPMELRVTRGTNGNVGRWPVLDRSAQNDLSRLVVEITPPRSRRSSRCDRGSCVPIRSPTSSTAAGSPRITPPEECRSPWSTCPINCARQIRWWEPGPNGSLLIYGTEGAGTAAVLASLAIGAAERYSADDFHLYVIDAGALAPLGALPHTGAVVRHDEVGRVTQLVELRRSGDRTGRASDVDARVAPPASRRHDRRRRRASTMSRRPPGGPTRSNADDVWAEIVRIVDRWPGVGVSTVATAQTRT